MDTPTAIKMNVPPLSKRDPHALYCEEPSLTIQAEKDECDINQIIARVAKGQDLSHVNQRVAQYGDFSNVPDYQSSLELVKNANGFFMAMSPEVRERFNNDPGQMLKFMQNADNYDEAVKLGLVIPKKVETPPAAAPEGSKEPSNPAPAASAAAK